MGNWLATQKMEDFEERFTEYLEDIFPASESDGSTSAWLSTFEVAQLKNRYTEHKVYGLLP